ncbi:hybrid sensor histidine kinase/response regulator [Geomesophilobacter sediminis]|uniref:histidine kinase n=1 Tax=Geomesophilobacter sediminis TaxID=2798584 RepID=A0A8J7SD99_9BACT|nr:PAS domain S-box protein [Geomesophilobacter sediminis]MBJ6727694.1 PAS domain S-box protein [Geomesophilobacter sediminis]
MRMDGLKGFSTKYGLVFFLCWTAVIGALASITLYFHHADTLKEAEHEARDYFRLNMFYRAWAAKMGGVYVDAGKVVPNPHLNVPDRDVTTTTGKQLTLVNPAYMTRMVFDSLRTASTDPIVSRIVSLKPLNPRNVPDVWERDALLGFEQRKYRERSEVAQIEGRPYLRLISAFITDPPCLKCHGFQGYRTGDIRGGITVSVPLTNRLLLERASDWRIGGGYLLLWIVGNVGIATASRRRWEYEKKLHASERKFRTVCDWTQDWEYWIGRDGSLQYVSPSALEVTGYPAEEFVKDPGLAIRIVHPEDRGAFETHTVDGHTRSGPVAESMEFRIVTRQGETRWIQHNCRPIFEGEVFLGRRASNRDITEQKGADAKVSRLSAIVESSDDAIISMSPDGIVTSWNRGAEKIFGFREAEMLGQRPTRLYPPDRFDEEGRILAVLAGGESVEPLETVRVDKEGRRLDLSVTASPIRDRVSGAVIGISVIARDISDMKRTAEERLQLERQMLQTQKLESLGVLAGGIAHDFNNILMAIIGNADLALMRINRESPARDNLLQVQDAASRAADLARQMLAYSGKGKFSIENIDLNLLVQEMTHMLEVSISKKAVLRFNLHQPLALIAADATQLRQIVMNLVINASEAIGDRSGVIAISTGCMNCDRRYLDQFSLEGTIEEGPYVYLEVADTGCGMDRETMARIFDPFFTTKFTGRGLGMAAVQGIIRGHKGAIKVYSELGKGTCFKVFFPSTSKLIDVVDERRVRDQEWKGSGTALLVDDEESVLGIGSDMLRELGFEVLTAPNGRQAVELFQAHRDRITCVILDLTMPHMDGEQTFRELRQIDPEVKVVMSSGYNEDEVTQKFTGKGLAGFIQKPYKCSTLQETLNAALGR